MSGVLMVSINNLQKIDMKKPLFFVALTANILVFGGFNTTLSAQETENAADSELDTSAKEFRHGRHERMQRRHAKMLEKVDTNQDGQLDLNEYLSHAEARFKTMDLNSDGYVTREEQMQAHKDMREKHKQMRKEWRKKHRESLREESDSDQ